MRATRALWIWAGAALSLSAGSAWGQITNQINTGAYGVDTAVSLPIRNTHFAGNTGRGA